MPKEARDHEIHAAAQPPPPPPPRNPVTYTRKKKRTGGASGSPADAGMCDDVLRGIFARVPARTAVASMAVSRHHKALLRCPEFRALHCRLAPPLPDPHVAYIATAKVKRSRDGRKQPVSGYHGFHVAGAGLSDSGTAPMRALAGPTCPRMTYVSTCRGVVLLVVKARPATCVLWNPAIADGEEEVRVPVSDDDDCAVLGLGYGRRSKTYKLLLSRRRKVTTPSTTRRDPKELLVYALSCGGGAGEQEQPRLRTLLSEGLDGEISGESHYLDGTVYLLHVDKAVMLAFDVDDETVTAIDLPGARDKHGCKIMSTTLLLISGRPCVDTLDSHGRALWLLTVDHQWERKCIIDDKASICRAVHHLDPYSLTGVWNCGGVLFMYWRKNWEWHNKDDKLCMLYCTATKKMIEVNLPRKLAPPKEWEYAMCWGYKPTLVTPRSIVGGDGEAIISQDEEDRRARTADIMAALLPLNERDRRKGHKATLHTVCFMEFLVRIMQKLPENMNEVAEMPLLKPEDSGMELYYSDSCDSDSDFEDRFMSCYKKARQTMILC